MAAPCKFCTHQAANFPWDSWVCTHTFTRTHVRTLTHTHSGICPRPLNGSTGVLPDSGGKAWLLHRDPDATLLTSHSWRARDPGLAAIPSCWRCRYRLRLIVLPSLFLPWFPLLPFLPSPSLSHSSSLFLLFLILSFSHFTFPSFASPPLHPTTHPLSP